MSRRLGLVALAALCAMALSAVAASGAFAGTTAVTCTAGSGTTDSNCTPGSSGGSSGHVTIAAGETTTLKLAAIGSTELKTKIGVATVVLKATGVECVGCTAKNTEEGGSMLVKGSGGKIKYTGVTINVASCKVTSETVETEALALRTFAPEAGVLRAEVSPESGTTEAVIHLEKSGSEACTLGSAITVTGHADGTAKGATGKFATGAEELKVGTQKAELIGEVSLEAGKEGVFNKAALTEL